MDGFPDSKTNAQSESQKPQLDFVGIGAPRCGTTWLTTALREHPEVVVSKPKEPHFFSNTEYYNRGFDWYQEFFKHCDTTKYVAGEFSTSYLADEQAIERLAMHYPNAKLVMVVRDPVERAYSHYLHNKNRGGLSQSFIEVVQDKEDPIVRNGYYGYDLERVLAHFSPEQVFVLHYSDIQDDPQGLLTSLFNFLNVASDFEPDSLVKKVNAAADHNYYSPKVNRLLRRSKRAVRRGKFRFLLPYLQGSWLSSLMHAFVDVNTRLQQQELSVDETEYKEAEKLLRQYYAVDQHHFHQLLQEWKRQEQTT